MTCRALRNSAFDTGWVGAFGTDVMTRWQTAFVTRPDFDVDAIRGCFPALRDGTAYFDGPGGSQTPTVVADATRDAMLHPLSNRGNITVAARNAEEIVVQ